MSIYLIDEATVNSDTVIIKFGRTVKISSLINANFIVQTDAATPVVISSPFKAIQSLTDYNQISRTLTLYWNKILASNTDFVLRIVNILDSSGILVAEEQIKFSTSIESATPIALQGPSGTIVNEVLIEDKSIRADLETGYQIIAKNPSFYIESILPSSGEFFVDNDYNNGRITITFSQRPASNFLTNQFFKVQKKKIQKTPIKWQNLNIKISMHSWRPIIFIDIPSLDATPVYYTDGKDYFESGYKYKIFISKEVGV